MELRILFEEEKDENNELHLRLKNVTEEKTGECSAAKASPKTWQLCVHRMNGDFTLCQFKNIPYVLNHKSAFHESSSTISSTEEKEERKKSQADHQGWNEVKKHFIFYMFC